MERLLPVRDGNRWLLVDGPRVVAVVPCADIPDREARASDVAAMAAAGPLRDALMLLSDATAIHLHEPTRESAVLIRDALRTAYQALLSARPK